MQNGNVTILKPTAVFRFFQEISNIPRGSGNEKEISDYLVNFAKEQKLEYVQDEYLNVVIKKNGTAGYENSPTVIIQGHVDMVCEKNNDTIHDFANDPIKLKVDGDFLMAQGTTLGADNGIAVAYGLALLASNDIVHPPVEVIFTTDEETGMGGARGLETSGLKGKMLVNIDSEEEGIFCVSCAGGTRASIKLPINEVETSSLNMSEKHGYRISLRGLSGGHSGMDIDKLKANANKLMGRILNRIDGEFDINIASISGGAKDNAIPREADVTIVTNGCESDIKAVLSELNDDFSKEFFTSESKIAIEYEKIDLPKVVFDRITTNSIISVLVLIPNGVQAMSAVNKSLVESSTNLGVIVSKGKFIEFHSAVRSSVSSRKHAICNKIARLALLVGADYESFGDYPAWEYCKNSKLRETFLKVFKSMYGREAEISSIHAGLECGLLSGKMPDVDMISFGPDTFDVHTPDEHISISSVERTWELLKQVLIELK